MKTPASSLWFAAAAVLFVAQAGFAASHSDCDFNDSSCFQLGSVGRILPDGSRATGGTLYSYGKSYTSLPQGSTTLLLAPKDGAVYVYDSASKSNTMNIGYLSAASLGAGEGMWTFTFAADASVRQLPHSVLDYWTCVDNSYLESMRAQIDQVEVTRGSQKVVLEARTYGPGQGLGTKPACGN